MEKNFQQEAWGSLMVEVHHQRINLFEQTDKMGI
jgi:hypothetical protein